MEIIVCYRLSCLFLNRSLLAFLYVVVALFTYIFEVISFLVYLRLLCLSNNQYTECITFITVRIFTFWAT